jgi:hypothetical protein
MCASPRSRCHRNGDNLASGLFSVDNLVLMPDLSTALFFCSVTATAFVFVAVWVFFKLSIPG